MHSAKGTFSPCDSVSGEIGCFINGLPSSETNVSDTRVTLEAVYDLILARRGADPQQSYVSSMNHKGEDAILRKIGEECCEVVIAAKNGEKGAAIHELADLWFHLLLWMGHAGITPADVEQELGRRFGRSGIPPASGAPEPPPNEP